MLFMANYETPNIPYGQPMTAEQYAKCVLDSDLSRTLYVVGVNVYGKPFRDELKKAGYDSTKALRLKEATDKKVKIAGFVDCSGSNGKDSIKNQIKILKNAGVTEIYYFSDKVYNTPESA
jgi:hypothetical protein